MTNSVKKSTDQSSHMVDSHFRLRISWVQPQPVSVIRNMIN